ncbi:VF530 family protein [Hymenobacter pini]|uniref:VF530 family protein n=1 Tax=Hymenobacter pini TaxID=2880879 RepID=UPI001CF11B89|nr:VF530 family protein [Hymenobacter pini]MCA8832498.1 VF530 family protein [Hymenobacter pini]
MPDLSNLPADARDESGRLIRELHGVTLAQILEYLVAAYGWPELDRRIRINCFAVNPSIKSSLTFLRRTPWARAKVEELYILTRTAEVLGRR